MKEGEETEVGGRIGGTVGEERMGKNKRRGVRGPESAGVGTYRVGGKD